MQVLLLALVSVLLAPTFATTIGTPTITEFTIQEENVLVSDVFFAPNNHTFGWFVDSVGAPYRTTDFGKTWEKRDVDTKQRRVSVNNIIMHPKNSMFAYFVSEFPPMFFTTHDGGDTIERVVADSFVLRAVFHPRDPLSALEISLSKDCNDLANLGSKNCHAQLWVTRDGGLTRKLLITHVAQASWAADREGEEVDDAIYVTTWLDKSRTTLGRNAADLMLLRSDDMFANVYQAGAHIVAFVVAPHWLVAVTRGIVPNVQKTHFTFMVSEQGSWACAPLPPDVHASEYHILDTSGDVLVLGVRDDSTIESDAIIFVSDSHGVNLVEVLRDVRRVGTSYAFQAVDKGVFLATKRIDPARNFRETAWETVVSHNYGSSWSAVVILEDYDYSKLMLPTTNAVLELVLGARVAQPPQSNEFAPGILSAVGTLHWALGDEQIHTQFDRVPHTFHSRDFGATWTRMQEKGTEAGVPNYSYRHELAASGSILLMIAYNGGSELYYSFDEGRTLNTIALSERIDEPVIEAPTDPKSLHFVVYGNGVGDNVLFHVDFSGVLPMCQGEATAGNDTSDYELFTPSDPIDGYDTCLLGRNRTFTRLKRDRECLDARTEHKFTITPCLCHDHDFECAFGFTPTSPSEPLGCAKAFEPQPAVCEGSYTYARFRKIAGDLCENGTDWATKKGLTTECISRGECGCGTHGSCGTTDQCVDLCICDEGYFGEKCDYVMTSCNSDNCINGQCKTQDYCECEGNWEGVRCDQEPLPPHIRSSESGGSGAIIAVLVVLLLAMLAVIIILSVLYYRHRRVVKA